MADSAAAPVRSMASRVFTVPTDQPEADGTLEWHSTTMVTAEVVAGDVTGLGWTYATGACRPLIEECWLRPSWGEMSSTCPPATRPWCVPVGTWAGPGWSAVPSRPWTSPCGTARPACSTLDWPTCSAVCWDVSLYGSGGFTTYDEATSRAQLEQWVGEWGISRVKIKIGEQWGTRTERDIARTQFARQVIGDEVELFVDANGGYSRKQAVRVGRELFESAGVVLVRGAGVVGRSHWAAPDPTATAARCGSGGIRLRRDVLRPHGGRPGGRLPADRRHPLRGLHLMAPLGGPGRGTWPGCVRALRAEPACPRRRLACPRRATSSTSMTTFASKACSLTESLIPTAAGCGRSGGFRVTAWPCTRE